MGRQVVNIRTYLGGELARLSKNWLKNTNTDYKQRADTHLGQVEK